MKQEASRKVLQLRGLTGNSRATASLMTFHKAMTLQEAKSIARHLGLTLRKVRSGDYRVNFRDGNQMTAYYTDSLEDAVNTAVEMARKRGGVSYTNVMTAAYALVEATNKCLAKNNKSDAGRPLK